MATKRTTRTASPPALRDLQALAKRLQRQLDKRRRLAGSTLATLEKDLRALTALLTKRATAVRADVEKHLRGLRRDLKRQAKVSGLVRPRRKSARKKK